MYIHEEVEYNSIRCAKYLMLNVAISCHSIPLIVIYCNGLREREGAMIIELNAV